MSAGWDEFYAEIQHAMNEQVDGRPDPYKALWSQRDDVVIMGAEGGCYSGWELVSEGLDLAATAILADARTVENVATIVGEDVAVTIDLEHITKTVPDGTEVKRTLRATHTCRVEDGRWRIFHRHADQYLADAQRLGEGPPGGGPPGFGPPGAGPPGGGPPGGGPPGGGPPQPTGGAR